MDSQHLQGTREVTTYGGPCDSNLTDSSLALCQYVEWEAGIVGADR